MALRQWVGPAQAGEAREIGVRQCQEILEDESFDPLRLDPLGADLIVEHADTVDHPVRSVTVRVVEEGSEDYKLAEEHGFIVDTRFFCENDSCYAVGYDIFVTPDELRSERVDQLVAIGFGTPRDRCSDPTPKWIQALEC